MFEEKASILDAFQDSDDGHRKYVALLGPGLNFVNSIIGSGIIGTAFAIDRSGLVLGLGVLVLAAVLTDFSLITLMKAAKKTGSESYQDLMFTAFGNGGYAILTIFQFVYPFIAMISYNIIVGDTVTKVLIRTTGVSPDSIIAQRETVVFLTTLVITLPLSLYRNIERLAKTSFLGLFIVGVIAVCIVVRAFTLSGIALPAEASVTYFRFEGLTRTFGVMSFAFMTHHNSFLIYSSLENPSIKNWAKLTHSSMITAFITMVVFGLGGYLTFLDMTQGDLLNNYCWSDDLMNFCRLAFTLTILLTYPIECFVCRDVAANIVKRIWSEETAEHFRTHVFLTILMVASTMLVSYSTRCLGIVLELNGLFLAVPLAYIFPSLCYCKVLDCDWLSRENIIPLIVTVFGVGVVVNDIVMLFIMTHDSGCEHADVEMPFCQQTNLSTNHLEL